MDLSKFLKQACDSFLEHSKELLDNNNGCESTKRARLAAIQIVDLIEEYDPHDDFYVMLMENAISKTKDELRFSVLQVHYRIIGENAMITHIRHNLLMLWVSNGNPQLIIGSLSWSLNSIASIFSYNEFETTHVTTSSSLLK